VEVGATAMMVVTDAMPASPVVLRVDASSISVFAATPGVSSHRNVFRGVVAGIVARGALLEVSMTGEIDLAALLTQGALDALDLSVGSDVWFGVKTAAIDVVGLG
jgi:ABC-type molybdate transport system ATPase subunit